MKNKKNLIKDILQYLQENEEAMDMFNDIGDIKYKYEFDESLGLPRFESFAWRNLINGKIFVELSTEEKQTFLLHALSSPQGKPICGFLETNKLNNGEYYDGNGNKCNIINHASTLFNLLTSQTEQGENFDKILIKLNEKYNEII